jgi:hypothetical protein
MTQFCVFYISSFQLIWILVYNAYNNTVKVKSTSIGMINEKKNKTATTSNLEANEWKYIQKCSKTAID